MEAFQQYKSEFKKELQKYEFLRENSIPKTYFFVMFLSFSNHTWSPELCKSAFEMTGLVPYNPD
jgi:hypothetical protein